MWGFVLALGLLPRADLAAQADDEPMPGFVRPSSGLELERPILPGAFFDVVGRRSAVFGSEGGSFEA